LYWNGGGGAVVVVEVVVVEMFRPANVVLVVELDVVAANDVAVAATGSEVAKPTVVTVDVLVPFALTRAADVLSLPTKMIVRKISVISTPQTVTNAMRLPAR
jgi:hypothetical protein